DVLAGGQEWRHCQFHHACAGGNNETTMKKYHRIRSKGIIMASGVYYRSKGCTIGCWDLKVA
ncbi:hypothetical protein A2U01_0119066, partial [Trifolium medium]|nr:hypothetical protein [Trifolium medium]